MGIIGKKGHEPNYPVASEMCLDVTADRSTPGALENCCSRTFFPLPDIHGLLFCSSLPLRISLSGLGCRALPSSLYLSLAPAWFVPLIASLPVSFTSASTSVLLQNCRKCSEKLW